MDRPYAGYDVLSKWETPSFDDVTREVVAQRIGPPPQRRFLNEAEWALLEAIVARLLPQPDRRDPIPIVPHIDRQLAEDRGDGYRYAGFPPVREAWRQGLAAVDAETETRHGCRFADLAPEEQDELLHQLQQGQTRNDPWGTMDASRFFGHYLLRTAAAIYYAHPDAWSEIGYGGPASPRGYVRLGEDARDSWEAPLAAR